LEICKRIDDDGGKIENRLCIEERFLLTLPLIIFNPFFIVFFVLNLQREYEQHTAAYTSKCAEKTEKKSCDAAIIMVIQTKNMHGSSDCCFLMDMPMMMMMLIVGIECGPLCADQGEDNT
jgi:hypothetical protein